MAGKGILLDENNDLLIRNKSLVIGNTEMQEVAVIIDLHQGELKHDPILGPEIVQMLKTNSSKLEVEKRLRVHLARDNKNYDAIKDKIKTTVNNA